MVDSTDNAQGMTDMDALMNAADALAEACGGVAKMAIMDDMADDLDVCILSAKTVKAIRRARHEYRAAREAVRKGTPPALATSA